LRDALIAAGMAALEGAGGLDLSLRELAREVGVSPAAVYRHFPNKDALLAEIARQGIAMLGEAQRAAYDAVGGGPAGFAETGRAYVRFALAHPALFRLAFAHGKEAVKADHCPDPAADLLHSSTLELMGGDPAAAERLAMQAWAIAHGLAMLMLDHRLPPDDALIDRLVDTRSLFPLGGGRVSGSDTR
jgi:AcrR family transcriptional regulator